MAQSPRNLYGVLTGGPLRGFWADWSLPISPRSVHHRPRRPRRRSLPERGGRLAAPSPAQGPAHPRRAPHSPRPSRPSAALAEHREIAYAAASAVPSNLVATVVTRDTAALYAYISVGLGRLEGVRHVETSPFMRKVKQLTYRPPVRQRPR
ncbi:Lrp/AsnC ligand binding domain-containing protein [Streptomyces sp. NPDC059262]|uniref:Lrp/AsnC ligand binding domain-containing protein n=1 Tax=Streptomyces sp. NPDC059262 TaxID=3346797 RepID=UPI0036B22815